VTEAPATVDTLCVNTIRTLSMDAVQQANSGHPGTPMALAPLAYRIYTRHLRHNPAAPDWVDRDRFVLSCGHASMLLYSTLHLCGYDVSLDNLKHFRQLGSPTAGHPERGELPGIETTTGPLGQGISNAVGMALAERMLAAKYNQGDHNVVDHWTYVLASDGDIMEGVQAEAASLAGHLALGRLIVFYDDNDITIDGAIGLSMSEDVAQRYDAYGWQTLRLEDPDDLDAVDALIAKAKADPRPTLIVTRTRIGIGSPLEGSSKAHGAPLGADNIERTKEGYGWPTDASFLVPDEVVESIRTQVEDRAAEHAAWEERYRAFQSDNSMLAAEFDRVQRRELPANWHDGLAELHFESGTQMATRQASGESIKALAPFVPELVGGSADLAESNLTDIPDSGAVSAGRYAARNIHFGVREHGMAAVANGMVAHGGLRPFVGTFLIFSDYMRPSIRLAALMGLPTTFVFTHDSVWLGEDGPTHQPIEHLSSLRAMPNLLTLRPADPVETKQAWRVALEQTSRPQLMALTRQKLNVLDYGKGRLSQPQVERGGYVLRDCECDGPPHVTLIGTGSEVHTCLAAADKLEATGTEVRVVSMPSWELFAEQPADYRTSVLGPGVRVAVEAGASHGWHRWVGEHGVIVGIDRFGTSAPGDQAAESLGISVDNVVKQTQAALETHNG
jgi:transketolase